MLNALDTVNRIIAEHVTIINEVQNLTQQANDEQLVRDAVKTVLMPSLLNDVREQQQLVVKVEKFAQQLHEHFSFEETSLMNAAQQYGDRHLSEAFGKLFLDHESLRGSFALVKRDVAALFSSPDLGQTAEKLEQTGYHLDTVCQLIAKHAQLEQRLLEELRQRLQTEH